MRQFFYACICMRLRCLSFKYFLQLTYFYWTDAAGENPVDWKIMKIVRITEQADDMAWAAPNK